MIICDKKIVRIPLDDETLTIRSNRSDGYASIVARSWLFDWMICWLWDNLRLGGLVMCCEKDGSSGCTRQPEFKTTYRKEPLPLPSIGTIMMQKEKIREHCLDGYKVTCLQSIRDYKHYLDNKELNMRPRRLLRLLNDFDGKIQYHPVKVSVAADALIRNERAKPF
ncbi:hypothetical protein Tco_1547793 [Tanacetum coccineum]